MYLALSIRRGHVKTLRIELTCLSKSNDNNHYSVSGNVLTSTLVIRLGLNNANFLTVVGSVVYFLGVVYRLWAGSFSFEVPP